MLEDKNSICEQDISECKEVTLMHCLSREEEEKQAEMKQLVQSHGPREKGTFNWSVVPEISTMVKELFL